jgi:glutamyl-tRNA reductase
MILGEEQILSQVKEAIVFARAAARGRGAGGLFRGR